MLCRPSCLCYFAGYAGLRLIILLLLTIFLANTVMASINLHYTPNNSFKYMIDSHNVCYVK